MLTRTLTAAVLGLAVLTACGSAPAGQDTASTMTAEQVVTELAGRVTTAKPGIVFTAETDTNKLLGRPNGYASKASFTDNRVKDDGSFMDTRDGAVDLGGSVEVFADEQAARARMNFIQEVAKGLPMVGEYASGGAMATARFT